MTQVKGNNVKASPSFRLRGVKDEMYRGDSIYVLVITAAKVEGCSTEGRLD
jgi:hypothetical protein